MTQVRARVAVAAAVVPLVLGASVTASALGARDALPRAADRVEAALASGESLERCLQDAQDDLYASATFQPTRASTAAARARLQRCDVNGFRHGVSAIDLPGPAPVQLTRRARARTELAESVRLLDQASSDAQTAVQAAASPGVAFDGELVIAAYRSFAAARARAAALYAKADRRLSVDRPVIIERAVPGD